jgi:hypothetical protein
MVHVPRDPVCEAEFARLLVSVADLDPIMLVEMQADAVEHADAAGPGTATHGGWFNMAGRV